jgi:hypothetical protein
MNIVFVKSSQGLFCGRLVGNENATPAMPIILSKPRMIFADHQSNQINLALMIGGADEVTLYAVDYVYVATDEEFITFYQEQTTLIPDLKIVK